MAKKPMGTIATGPLQNIMAAMAPKAGPAPAPVAAKPRGKKPPRFTAKKRHPAMGGG